MVVSIITGILWLEFLVDFLIDMVVFVQIMTGRSELFMGMTVLAISNSTIDMFVGGSLASQGYEIMAIIGVFAGQMFNFLFGFGLACFIKFFGSSKFKTFNLYKISTWESDKEGRMTFSILIWLLVIIVFLIFSLVKSK